MIKCGQGHVKIGGTKAELLAEFATIVHVLNERKIFTEEELRDAFEDGFKTPAEVNRETVDILMGLLFGVNRDDFLAECKRRMNNGE